MCVCVRICQVLLPHGPEPVCVCVFEGSAVFYSPMLLSVCVCVRVHACVLGEEQHISNYMPLSE